MSLWKLGLISAFALVFVIGTAPAFASDEADAEAAEEMEMEEEDVAVIEITEIIEDLHTLLQDREIRSTTTKYPNHRFPIFPHILSLIHI